MPVAQSAHMARQARAVPRVIACARASRRATVDMLCNFAAVAILSRFDGVPVLGVANPATPGGT
eukprot:11829896-Alexandrium_andersonii.AAC.1